MTFLFTDVEGSTGLWERDPDGMREALAAHDEVLRSAIAAHGGYVFSTGGDGFAAAFWTAPEGLEAAVEAQRRLTAGLGRVALRVRMGVHTGTAEERDGDYFGPAVNRAARLMSAGHGGQVLVSLATEELVRDRLPEGVGLVDLGDHALTGLGRPERLFQVVGAGLTGPVSRLRAPRAAGNLVKPVTALVGHAEELTRLAGELPNRRLITLTGVGGVGKTRLATEVAWSAGDAFPDGVWMCELAPLAEPDAVAHTVGTTLSLRPQEGLSMVDSVVDALRNRRLLLILDNCEHVLSAAAELCGRITRRCGAVSVLATSREPLGVPAERVWPVPSLSPSEGAELFADRACAADAAFSPGEEDRDVILRICERLDGIPLAIELAAARIRSLTPRDLADRLDDRFRLLRGGRRGVERHQTLRTTVQWSYQLLQPNERALFDRLAVFAGGFDLAAARTVCADANFDADDVDELLAGLVDKSMVVADRSGPHVRFRLLETLRQYGEERLADRDDATLVRERHLAYYGEVAEHARRDYEASDHAAGAATFQAEWENIRVAVQWAVIAGRPERASEMLRALFFFAWIDVRYEVGHWADELLRAGCTSPVVYGVAAFFAAQRAELDRALRLAEAGLARSPEKSSPGVWLCWYAATFAHWYSGKRHEGWAAVQALNQTVDPARDPFAAAWAAANGAAAAAQVSNAERDAGEVGSASSSSFLERLDRIAGQLHNPAVDVLRLWAAGIAERSAGRFDTALGRFRSALALAEGSGNRLMVGMCAVSTAVLATIAKSEGAERILHEALTLVYANRDWIHVWPTVESIAIHWATAGPKEPAAVLFGHLEDRNIHHTAFIQHRTAAAEVLQDLPNRDSWFARGATLDRDQLVSFALRQLAEAAHP